MMCCSRGLLASNTGAPVLLRVLPVAEVQGRQVIQMFSRQMHQMRLAEMTNIACNLGRCQLNPIDYYRLLYNQQHFPKHCR